MAGKGTAGVPGMGSVSPRKRLAGMPPMGLGAADHDNDTAVKLKRGGRAKTPKYHTGGRVHSGCKDSDDN